MPLGFFLFVLFARLEVELELPGYLILHGMGMGMGMLFAVTVAIHGLLLLRMKIGLILYHTRMPQVRARPSFQSGSTSCFSGLTDIHVCMHGVLCLPQFVYPQKSRRGPTLSSYDFQVYCTVTPNKKAQTAPRSGILETPSPVNHLGFTGSDPPFV